MTNLTKQSLAQALRTLLTRSPLGGITVQDIVNEAGVSRKTFYYHFHDIYDLMEWVLYEDADRMVEVNEKAGNWQQSMVNVLEYMRENKALVYNLVDSLQDGMLRDSIHDLVVPLLTRTFQELNVSLHLPQAQLDFFMAMQAHGVVGILFDWISDGMKGSPESLIEKFASYVEFLGSRAEEK